MQMTDVTPLDGEQMANIWSVYRTHPTVGCCVQAIRNCVFGGGLQLHGATNASHQLHFEKLAHAALDWIICVGVVPMLIHPVEKQVLLPLVPQPEAVKLFVRLDPFGQRYFAGALDNAHNMMASVVTGTASEDQAKHAVIVWSGGEYLPTSRGKLTTPITHLESNERFMSIIRENALVASMLQANPTLISRNLPRANADNDGVVWNVDEQTIAAAEEDRLRRHANTTEREFKLHQERWGEGGIPTTQQELSDFNKRCHPREYFLAQDRDIVRPPEPLFPHNYHEINRQCEEKIYQIFGVPYGMFSNSGTHVQSNYMQIFALNGNLKRIKRQVEQFLQEAIQLCEVLKPSKPGASELERAPFTAQTSPRRSPKKSSDELPQDTFLNAATGPESVKPLKHNPANRAKRDLEEEELDLLPANPENLENKQHKKSKHEIDMATPVDDHDTALDPFERALKSQEATTQKEPRVVLPGVPCIQQEEIQKMREAGYLSQSEAANAVRSMLGMGIISESKVKQQKADYDKEFVALEKALAKARTVQTATPAPAPHTATQAPAPQPKTRDAPDRSKAPSDGPDTTISPPKKTAATPGLAKGTSAEKKA